MQQAASMASSAPQAAASAIQQPAQLATQAPQMLQSAPQALGQLLTQMGGHGASGLGGQPGAAMPVGFPGTGAIKGFNPAGMTSLAGGAFGSGPSRPLMPSTWGASPATTAEMAGGATRGISPVATPLSGAGASGSGAGGGMMGSGAHRKRNSRSEAVDTYADDALDEDDDVDGGTFAMAR